MDNLKADMEKFFARLENVCASCGRNKREIKIVAATKCVPADIIMRLPEFGITDAGENRVQEFNEKFREDSPLKWHIIGALQTNKVKYVVGKAVCIQSVDRLNLAEEINRISQKRQVVTNVLIEVNIGAEENKSGVLYGQAEELAAQCSALKNICVKGLMSVPPVNSDAKPYEKMRKLYETLQTKYSHFDTLSMGMSNDFEIAVKSGATMIRPGRVLFGERNYASKIL